MKIKAYKVFEFSELSEKAQEKAIEKLRNCNTEEAWWYEGVYEDWKQKLEDMGYEKPEIQFSGFWSQGDGASFTCKNIDLAKWVKATKSKEFKPFVKWTKDNYAKFWVQRNSHHYSHEMTVSAIGEWDDCDPKLGNPEQALTDHLRKQCRLIYADLEKEYEFQSSKEAIKNTIEANEWTFREDGTMDNIRDNNLEVTLA